MTKTMRTVWFLLASSLAGGLVGLVVLSPKLERNRLLFEICYQRQVELVELEEKNQRREFLLSRLKNDPQLLSQLASHDENFSDQHITVPEQLSIRPDALLHLEFESSGLLANSGQNGLSGGLRDRQQAGNPTLLRRWQKQISQSAELRKWLLIVAGGLVLAGLIDWAKLLNPGNWTGKGARQLKRWLKRYEIQQPHSPVGTPHYSSGFEGEQTDSQQTEDLKTSAKHSASER